MTSPVTPSVVPPRSWAAAAVGTGTTAERVLLGAARALLRAAKEEEVVGVVIEAVRDLGGGIAPPSTHGSGELPVDVSLGVGGPLVPTGDPGTLLVLGSVLPSLVDDAQVALARLRRETHFAESASTDALTGLPNRRAAMRVLGRLRAGDTVVMLDLDHFKAVNDTLGHDAGDAVLRAFARSVRSVVRAFDSPGRLGGEEFVLLLPHTDTDGALTLLARLRVAWLTVRPHPVTFSAGVAAVHARAAREALTRADEALYRAKNGGRDRFEVAE
jgi:diguanylate cyclase (GGDEF)-like protein